MQHITMTATLAVAIVIATELLAQTPMKPTAPGTPGDTTWQGVVRLSDGRTFVTDGGLAIDAALAKPARLPGSVRFRMTEGLQPVVVLAHGKVVGVLMPVRQ